MKTSALSRVFLITTTGISLGLFGVSVSATSIKVAITVDNSYALFVGSETSATTFVGKDFDWPSTETYTFDLPSSQFIYVVTASDRSVAQGFLGQFENLDNGNKFYSSDPQWEVMATGLGSAAPYSGSAADLSLLTTEILDANGGGNPSGGWVGLTSGPSNGAAPWGTRPGIDTAAKWVWYSSNGDPDPTTPGFDHSEWLVFRISVAAAPNGVPDGGSALGLMSVAFVGLGLAKRFVLRR